MWIAPFSGPSQRNWLSPTIRRENARVSAIASSSDTPVDHRFHGPDGGRLDVVAAADGEDQAVADLAARRAENDVGRRIVRERVHRVGTVPLARRREPDVVHVECGDRVAHVVCACPEAIRLSTKAPRMMAPLSKLIHSAGTPPSVRTFWMMKSNRTPVNAPKIVPLPPFRLMPPMTAAAKTLKM